MKKDDFFSAFGKIDPEIIADAAPCERHAKVSKPAFFVKRIALVACIALIFASITAVVAVHFNSAEKNVPPPDHYTSSKPCSTTGDKDHSLTEMPPQQTESWELVARPVFEDVTPAWSNLLGDSVRLSFSSERSYYHPGEVASIDVILHLQKGESGFLNDGRYLLSISDASQKILPTFSELPNGAEIVGEDLIIPLACFSEQDTVIFSVFLTPNWTEEFARGAVNIRLSYLPNDLDAFKKKLSLNLSPEDYTNFTKHFLTEGKISLLYSEVYYAADFCETKISDRRADQYGFYDLIVRHYNQNLISGEELARLYYESECENTVYASIVSYINDTKQFKFDYYSKNIRYRAQIYYNDEEAFETLEKINELWNNRNESPDLNKEEINQLERKLARLLLTDMYNSGVITADEYASETEWLDAVNKVYNSSIGYSSSVLFDYISVIEKFGDTHHDDVTDV